MTAPSLFKSTVNHGLLIWTGLRGKSLAFIFSLVEIIVLLLAGAQQTGGSPRQGGHRQTDGKLRKRPQTCTDQPEGGEISHPLSPIVARTLMRTSGTNVFNTRGSRVTVPINTAEQIMTAPKNHHWKVILLMTN